MFYLEPRSTSVSPTNADGGEDDYIIANDVTGTAFLATEAAARFATYLDGETSLAAAAGRARLPEDQAKFSIVSAEAPAAIAPIVGCRASATRRKRARR